MAIQILKWIRGWRLDKFFSKDTENKDLLKEAAAHAVILLDKIRAVSESPTLEAIVAAIPGDWDSKIVNKVKEILPKVVDAITKNSACLEQPTFEGKLSCILSNIAADPDDIERASGWQKIASFITMEWAKATSDGKLDINDVFIAVADGWRVFVKKK